MEPFYFRRLDVYRNAKQLSRLIYELLRKYPAEERFALCSQLRRAVTSIPINIAEGFGRFSSKEKAHFIEIAFGSVTEVLCEIELSLDEGYISQEEFKQVEERLSVIGKQLSGLHSSILRNGDSRIRER
ncbi:MULTISPECIES: four helix bundle protein [Hoylesella]|jgi:S23 ribosomal protein.|uniref:Four helix bundle protein n=1 Tax=Hoylesella enoeca TaxID=76123 RepID=A0A0S2KNK7_9BACT|nr:MULTISPECIES: four helix bundle protein [Hoylesella]ALO49683.1 four helix bundle protein [Hoylesella enoeca]